MEERPNIGKKDYYRKEIIKEIIQLIEAEDKNEIIIIINEYNKDNQEEIIEKVITKLENNNEEENKEWFERKIVNKYRKIHKNKDSIEDIDESYDYELGEKDYISEKKINKFKQIIKNRDRRLFVRLINRYDKKNQIKIIDRLYEILKEDEDSFKWFIENIEKSHNKFIRRLKQTKDKKSKYNETYLLDIEPTLGTLTTIQQNTLNNLIYYTQNHNNYDIRRLLNFHNKDTQKYLIGRLYTIFLEDKNYKWLYKYIIEPYTIFHNRIGEYKMQDINFESLKIILTDLITKRDNLKIYEILNQYDYNSRQQIINYFINYLKFNNEYLDWFINNIQVPYKNLYTQYYIYGGSKYFNKYIKTKNKYLKLINNNLIN